MNIEDNMKKIDFGCGSLKRPGFLGVDVLNLPNIDIKHDLNKFPYPFSDNEIDEVWLDQVLEHLENPVKVMEEIHRICKNGARVFVGVPYFRSFYATIDPTHKNFFGALWFDYFDPRKDFFKKYHYTKAQFLIERLEFDREFKKGKINFLKRKLIEYAERSPLWYESKLSHFFPLNSLTFYLKVVK